MDYRLGLMTGADLPLPECGLVLHQPSILEISYIGEQSFFIGVQVLTINSSMYIEDKNVLMNTTNFQVFMAIIKEPDKKEAVIQVLSLILPNNKVLFTPQSLIVQKEGESITIDDSNFENLQIMLRMIFCSKDGPMDQNSFNPGNEAARKIAEKLMRGRRIAAEQNGQANASIFSIYLSTLSIGIPMDLNSLTKLTMFQLYDLAERYQLYLSWDLDIRSRLAGGKPDSKPDNWMKNIH